MSTIFSPVQSSTSDIVNRRNISSLPHECLAIILSYVKDPSCLVQSCSAFSHVSCRASARIAWLINKYGLPHALESALGCHSKLVDLHCFECLLRTAPVVPRYVVQRAFTRLHVLNKSDLIVPLLQYGLSHYDDLSLNKSDTQSFREAVSPALSPFSLSLFLDFSSLTDEARIHRLRTLVEKYYFDVNFCAWVPETGRVSPWVREGYKAFLTAIESKATGLVKALLEFKIATHIEPQYIDLELRDPRGGLQAYGSSTLLNWILVLFPSDVRPYLPRSCDALYLAIRQRDTEVMTLLLEADQQRWETKEEGILVLRNALQFAVDECYIPAAELISSFLRSAAKAHMERKSKRNAAIPACSSPVRAGGASSSSSSAQFSSPFSVRYSNFMLPPRNATSAAAAATIAAALTNEFPRMSPAALRRLLIRECDSANPNLSYIRQLIADGARFDPSHATNPGVSGPFAFNPHYPQPPSRSGLSAIIEDKIFDAAAGIRFTLDLLKCLMDCYPFTPAELREMLIRAIHARSAKIVKTIVRYKKGPADITQRTLKEAIMKGQPDGLKYLLRDLRAHQPYRVVTGFPALLRFAQSRFDKGRDSNQFVLQLTAYRDEIESNKADKLAESVASSSRRRKTSGAGTGKHVEKGGKGKDVDLDFVKGNGKSRKSVKGKGKGNEPEPPDHKGSTFRHVGKGKGPSTTTSRGERGSKRAAAVKAAMAISKTSTEGEEEDEENESAHNDDETGKPKSVSDSNGIVWTDDENEGETSSPLERMRSFYDDYYDDEYDEDYAGSFMSDEWSDEDDFPFWIHEPGHFGLPPAPTHSGLVYHYDDLLYDFY
ncbi:hypothetical protein BJ742DRAFT_792849 [Cladochytrium replicatum]|nr:hypothetical protein BJ742DRAFT_792849 [Cladochytrium replicatum]